MEFDVTIDRNKYIGGSDIPIIMGISPFKTRWQLLLEKSGIEENEFKGNDYTEYGHIIEPQIREFINKSMPKNAQFEPNQVIKGDFRSHTDGFNGYCVLEIKSTSHIHETVDKYKMYLVQLLKYMQENEVENGLLAVYERPDDFNTEFDPKRLLTFEVEGEKYKDLLQTINAEIDRFRVDLAKLKANPLLTEEDLQPTELITLSNKVIALENRMAEYKAIEAEQKAMKQKLFEAMLKHNVKTWELFNGTKITRVDGTEPTVELVEEFDEKAFKKEQPEQYKLYTKTVEKKKSGRSGYVKVTFPKSGT